MSRNRPGRRYEAVHGELLVAPAPTLWQQEVAGRLYVVPSATCLHPPPTSHGVPTRWSSRTCWWLISPRHARYWSKVKQLLLAIEVLSLTTARYDRFTKRRLYQEVGVPVYWIVDPDEQLVEVWTPDDALSVTCPEALSGEAVTALRSEHPPQAQCGHDWQQLLTRLPAGRVKPIPIWIDQ